MPAIVAIHGEDAKNAVVYTVPSRDNHGLGSAGKAIGRKKIAGRMWGDGIPSPPGKACERVASLPARRDAPEAPGSAQIGNGSRNTTLGLGTQNRGAKGLCTAGE